MPPSTHTLARRRRRLLPAAVAGVALLAGASCSSGGDVTLPIFTAASLADTFEQLADTFEAEHEGVTVEIVAAGSSTLISQIEAGDDAAVLATADEESMANATEAGLVGDATGIARNQLVLVTPAGNPAGVTGLDGSLDGANLVVCAPQVPCGRASLELADLLGITIDPVSAKVTSGEADAGLVYTTDAQRAGDDVEVIDVPEAVEAYVAPQIATVSGSDQQDLANEFIELVTGQVGQDALAEAGFAPAE
jgi:molybdate transport system substrate-binding protein